MINGRKIFEQVLGRILYQLQQVSPGYGYKLKFEIIDAVKEEKEKVDKMVLAGLVEEKDRGLYYKYDHPSDNAQKIEEIISALEEVSRDMAKPGKATNPGATYD